jgi:hypothetical protein
LWLAGYGFRTIEPMVRPDRKTIRRIVEIAVEEGLDRAGGDVGDQRKSRSVISEIRVGGVGVSPGW